MPFMVTTNIAVLGLVKNEWRLMTKTTHDIESSIADACHRKQMEHTYVVIEPLNTFDPPTFRHVIFHEVHSVSVEDI